jgi:DNA primase
LITQNSVQEIIDTAKIEEVVEDFVNLKKRGVNMIGLCPFHNEKTPSFTVSPTKNIFKCFGCGRGGNPVQFLMEHEKMNFPEALRYIADKYNIEIEETQRSEEEIESSQIKESYFIINEYTQKEFHKNLFLTDEGKSVGLQYFKQRGYREATINKFKLGYALRDRNDITKKAVDQGYNIEYLRELGITTQRDQDFFNGRVMFSFHSLSGKVIGFGGRTLSTDKKTPKYLNSPESEVFNKRNTIYGAYFAKRAIRQADECILVEGYTDVLTLHQSGIENVVASSGTSLTTSQIRSIKRFTDNIKIIYDGDPAGVKAAMRGLDLVLEQNMNVKLVLLPENSDPDSYLNEVGREKFMHFLDTAAQDFIFFKLSTLLDETENDPIKRSKVVKDIVDSIAKIPDTLKRVFYIKECAQQLEIGENILIGAVNKRLKDDLKKKRIVKRTEEARIQTPEYIPDGAPFPTDIQEKQESQTSSNSSSFQEKDLVRIIMTMGDNLVDADQNVNVAQYIIMNIEEVIDKFDSQLYKEVIIDAAKRISEGGDLSAKYFTNHSNPQIQELAINMLTSSFDYSSNWEKRWGIILQTQKDPEDNFIKDSYQAVLRFKLKKFNKQISDVKNKLQEDNSIDPTLLLKLHHSLVTDRNKIAKELNTIVFH